MAQIPEIGAICVICGLLFLASLTAQPLPGEKLFNPACSNMYCHGPGGSGGAGPSLKTKTYTRDFLTRVISDGVAGTTMRGFKDELSREQIQQLAAYILSFRKQEAPPPTAPAAAGDFKEGRKIFFDAADERSCRVCHAFNGVGGKMASDLSKAGQKSAKDLLESILNPKAAVDRAYASVAVTLKSGERLTGIRREETPEIFKMWDAAGLPPVSRTLLKSEIAKIEKIEGSPMPADYGKRLSQKQLLDLISFLKQAPVAAKDLF